MFRAISLHRDESLCFGTCSEVFVWVLVSSCLCVCLCVRLFVSVSCCLRHGVFPHKSEHMNIDVLGAHTPSRGGAELPEREAERGADRGLGESAGHAEEDAAPRHVWRFGVQTAPCPEGGIQITGPKQGLRRCRCRSQ